MPNFSPSDPALDSACSYAAFSLMRADMAALLVARKTPEWRASSADEANFIDHRKVAYFVSEELIIQ